MGLDGSVMCRCWQDGLVTPPDELGVLVIDEEGLLNLTREPTTDAEWDRWSALLRWQREACEHEDMDLVSVRVGNWSGYRQLQHALGEVGWEHFPTLKAELPNANGGCTASEASAAALREIEHFLERAPRIPLATLWDCDRGAVMRREVVAHDGVFSLSPTSCVGLDKRGLFVTSGPEGPEVWRGMRVEQRKLSHDRVTLRNEHGQTCVAPAIVDCDPDWVPLRPNVMEVTVEYVGAEEYAHGIGALRQLFTASVQTGNPVRWS